MFDREETCAICGYVSHLGAVARHHIIPQSVTQEAGVLDSAMANLCLNCRHELQVWYQARVVDTTYDTGAKQFRERSWAEKARDYDSAFNSFKEYRSEQEKAARRRR